MQFIHTFLGLLYAFFPLVPELAIVGVRHLSPRRKVNGFSLRRLA